MSRRPRRTRRIALVSSSRLVQSCRARLCGKEVSPTPPLDCAWTPLGQGNILGERAPDGMHLSRPAPTEGQITVTPIKKLQENSMYWRYRFFTRRQLAVRRWWRELRQSRLRPRDIERKRNCALDSPLLVAGAWPPRIPMPGPAASTLGAASLSWWLWQQYGPPWISPRSINQVF